MAPERKAAYRYLIYQRLIHLRGIGGGAMGEVPSFGFLLRNWRWIARGLHRTYWLADSVHNLAQFSAQDFEGFDEERFWRQAHIEDLQEEFVRYEARMHRKQETGEWMPKSSASVSEITQWLKRALDKITPDEAARIEEAIQQIKDFPVDVACVSAGIELIEKTTESKMMTGPYVNLSYELSDPRYEAVVSEIHRIQPNWVTLYLLRRYEHQRGTLRA